MLDTLCKAPILVYFSFLFYRIPTLRTINNSHGSGNKHSQQLEVVYMQKKKILRTLDVLTHFMQQLSEELTTIVQTSNIGKLKKREV